MQYKKQYIGAMSSSSEGLFGQFGFNRIRGEVKFVDKNTMRVKDDTAVSEKVAVDQK